MSYPVVALIKTTKHGDDTYSKILGVYLDLEDVLNRVERIAKANPKYPMRKVGSSSWTIGPEEDQGFFGDEEVSLDAQWTTLYDEGSA